MSASTMAGVAVGILVSIILVILFVFFPIIIAFIFLGISLFTFVLFKTTGNVISSILKNHNELTNDQQYLIRQNPHYYGNFFGQMLFGGIISTFKLDCLLLVLGLIFKGQYLFSPLGVICFLLLFFAKLTFDPRITYSNMIRKAKDNDQLKLFFYMQKLSEDTFYQLNTWLFVIILQNLNQTNQIYKKYCIHFYIWIIVDQWSKLWA